MAKNSDKTIRKDSDDKNDSSDNSSGSSDSSNDRKESNDTKDRKDEGKFEKNSSYSFSEYSQDSRSETLSGNFQLERSTEKDQVFDIIIPPLNVTLTKNETSVLESNIIVYFIFSVTVKTSEGLINTGVLIEHISNKTENLLIEGFRNDTSQEFGHVDRIFMVNKGEIVQGAKCPGFEYQEGVGCSVILSSFSIIFYTENYETSQRNDQLMYSQNNTVEENDESIYSGNKTVEENENSTNAIKFRSLEIIEHRLHQGEFANKEEFPYLQNLSYIGSVPSQNQTMILAKLDKWNYSSGTGTLMKEGKTPKRAGAIAVGVIGMILSILALVFVFLTLKKRNNEENKNSKSEIPLFTKNHKRMEEKGMIQFANRNTNDCKLPPAATLSSESSDAEDEKYSNASKEKKLANGKSSSSKDARHKLSYKTSRVKSNISEDLHRPSGNSRIQRTNSNNLNLPSNNSRVPRTNSQYRKALSDMVGVTTDKSNEQLGFQKQSWHSSSVMTPDDIHPRRGYSRKRSYEI